MVQIYGTLGPACAQEDTLRKMFQNGMTGVRLNLSHTTLSAAANRIEMMRTAAAREGIVPEFLVDIQGPEIRTGLVSEPVLLEEGKKVLLCPISGMPGKQGRNTIVELPEAMLSAIDEGDELLLDDGKLRLLVGRKEDSEEGWVHTAEVLAGGLLSSRKSAACVGKEIPLPPLSEADVFTLMVAGNYGVTGIMQPFVRSAADLMPVKKLLSAAGGDKIRLFAKIENRTGAEHISEIITAADEIVIARGDLGNAYPLWELPGVQKRISSLCKKAGRDFMVVTQMLASMEERPVPTRAEVSDIYNAVLDGAASVMVTGETAAGKYPAEVIRYLANTVRCAEQDFKR